MRVFGSLLIGVVMTLLASEVAARPKRSASTKAESARSTESTRAERSAKRAKSKLAAKLAAKGLAFGDEVFIRVFKEEAVLELWLRHGKRFERLKTYEVCAASGGLGPKQRVGDEQVPEGFYSVPAAAMNPESSYHLSFDVGYPNAFDKRLGRTGSLIMIHGDCVSIGCLAMTDEGIEEIFSLVDAAHAKGQKSVDVHLFPFRMTKENIARHPNRTWRKFWENLRRGYEHFEETRVPPVVKIRGGRYTFSRR